MAKENQYIQQKLTTSDVLIKQVAIEVKVLKIGNHQVTLSVFRQLKQEDIFDADTGELLGTPWGTVNYHVDCEDIKGEHLHVVWQKGNELRRAIACIPWRLRKNSYLSECFYFDMRSDLHEMAGAFIIARVLEGWAPDPTQLHDTIQIETELLTISTSLPSEVYKLFAGRGAKQELEERDITKLKTELDKLNAPYNSEVIYKTLITPLAADFYARKNRWEQNYKEIADLDQLFIAV
ncbi:hypothetical protein [Ktedonospora formicarum]|uniref:Uncharacterized protein n=1 Tax=Ktedonospora formicarum TaxID=2778364 RepID=A0A8J3MXA1_9CHLR|nr:hypothetical protein [Ktedonospora formicarum]GHO49766.1 hypothetical protein KSX_79290 [Ktedonospora formicarum]